MTTKATRLEQSAKAIDALLRGAQNRTLKPKDVNHLGPMVIEGIAFLEGGARNLRAQEAERRAAEEGRVAQ